MTDLLEREIRNRIYQVVLKNPGWHLSKIAEKVNIRVSLAEYHLKYLEKNGLILSVKKKGGYHRRYYVTNSEIGVEDKRILEILRQEKLVTIISLLIQNPNMRHKDLLKKFNITSSTLSYHINKLKEYGIIDISLYGEEKGYQLKNKKKIIQLLIKYESRRLVKDFKDIWDDFKYWK